jgi:hypothetical protein
VMGILHRAVEIHAIRRSIKLISHQSTSLRVIRVRRKPGYTTRRILDWKFCNMVRLLISSLLLLLHLISGSLAAGRDKDVWSIGNVELRPEASPLPEIKFGFWRRLHPDCAKSKINPDGCLIPDDQRISNRTCSGPVSTSNEWQVCPGRKQQGSLRFRVKKNTFTYSDRSRTKLTIEVVRKEEIHE